MKRGEPQINRDHHGACYVIVDDDGEPLNPDFIFDLDEAKELRNETIGWEEARIVMCGYRVFAEEPEVVDDPKRRAA